MWELLFLTPLAGVVCWCGWKLATDRDDFRGDVDTGECCDCGGATSDPVRCRDCYMELGSGD